MAHWFKKVSCFKISNVSSQWLLPCSKWFWSRSPLTQYRSIQLDSSFSLTEGDRHLDTFRLWESLSCGCIPLVNDHLNSASLLLPNGHPIPVFQSWDSALLYAKDLLRDPKRLDHTQMTITSMVAAIL